MSVVVVAVVVALAISWRVVSARRRRQTSNDTAPPTHHLRGYVMMVAEREVRERFRGRIFRVGTVLILLAVGAAIVIPTLHHGSAATEKVGVVGSLSAPSRHAIDSSALTAGTTVRYVNESSLTLARDLRTGRIDLAVDKAELLVYRAISPSDTSTHAAFVQLTALNLGILRATQSAHLTVAQATALARAHPFTVFSMVPGSAKASNLSSTLIGLILTFVMLTQYNGWILMGVMEEKSSRVIEVLLAALRPLQLLSGKVLGIGVVALSQAVLIVSFAVALSAGVGSHFLHGAATLTLMSSLLWLVLGYAFYCWVYAAAGSMAERQDQVQSLAFPLSVPIIFAYVVSLTTATSGNASALFKVLAYFPPTAPLAMPVLVGLHQVTWWQFTFAVALSVAGTFATAHFAATIYRRAILRTGRRVKVRELMTHSKR